MIDIRLLTQHLDEFIAEPDVEYASLTWTRADGITFTLTAGRYDEDDEEDQADDDAPAELFTHTYAGRLDGKACDLCARPAAHRIHAEES